MKKFMIIVVLVMMIFGTVGCGQEDSTSDFRNIYSYDEETGGTVYYDENGTKWTADEWNKTHAKTGGNVYFGFNS